jgi:hypothetical protein
VKDIEKDLIENDPLKRFQTDIDTKKDDENENDSFETIEPPASWINLPHGWGIFWQDLKRPGLALTYGHVLPLLLK